MKIYFFLLVVLFVKTVTSQLQTYDCTASGNFRYQDPTCRSFYMCELYNGNFVKSNYTCPSTMVFNPSTQVCSSNSICINNICDGKSPLVKIPDPNSPTCKNYIQCYGILSRYPVVQTCSGALAGFFNTDYSDCWLWGKC